jgi:uncharacterized lipoprotein YmbA
LITIRPGGIRIAALFLCLASCGGGTALRLYDLNGAVPAVTLSGSDKNFQVIALDRVTIPDELDSTDMLRRRGAHELVASPSGRWGERLSQAITDALAARLANAEPHLAFTTLFNAHPAARLIIVIERLDMGADGACFMQAHWQIVRAQQTAAQTSMRGSFRATATAGDDGAAVAALAGMLDQLAATISADLHDAVLAAPS